MDLDIERAKDTAKQLRLELSADDENWATWTSAKVEALNMFPPLVSNWAKLRHHVLREMTLKIADENGLMPRLLASDPARADIMEKCEREAIKRLQKIGVW